MVGASPYSCFFFFNDTATTEIYTLSLHDALPISLISPYLKAEALRLRCGRIVLARLLERSSLDGNVAMPSTEKLDTHQKALTLNLDPSTIGSFAEIGAGQEVARWFLVEIGRAHV